MDMGHFFLWDRDLKRKSSSSVEANSGHYDGKMCSFHEKYDRSVEDFNDTAVKFLTLSSTSTYYRFNVCAVDTIFKLNQLTQKSFLTWLSRLFSESVYLVSIFRISSLRVLS